MDGDPAGNDRIVHAGPIAQAVDFFLVAVEAQRIRRIKSGFGFLKAAWICQQENPIHGIEQEMVPARRANLKVLLKFQDVDHGSAFRTFRPQPFRHVIALLFAAERRFAKNAHGVLLVVFVKR